MKANGNVKMRQEGSTTQRNEVQQENEAQKRQPEKRSREGLGAQVKKIVGKDRKVGLEVRGVEAGENYNKKYSDEGQEVGENNPEEEKGLLKEDSHGDRPGRGPGEGQEKRPRDDEPGVNKEKRRKTSSSRTK